MNNLFLSTSIHTSTKFLWPKRRIRVTIGILNAGRGAVSSVLIYGDDFLVEKAFGKLVTGEGLEDLVESNCHRFTYPNVTLEQLKLTCLILVVMCMGTTCNCFFTNGLEKLRHSNQQKH